MASEFNAQLRLLTNQYPCVIRDFSQTGVLAGLGDQALAQLRASPDGLTGSLLMSLPERSVSMEVQLVRLTDQGAGLRLSKPQSSHYRAFQQAAERARQRSSTAAKQSGAASGRTLDRAMKERLASAANNAFLLFLEDRLLAYFDQLDTALVVETDRQKNQAAQQPFFDAVALMRKQRPRVLLATVNRISEAILDLAQGQQGSKQQVMRKPAASKTLELVDKDDFEDWLVVRVAVSRAEAETRDDLIELQLRIDAAFSGKPVKRLFNPFSPAALCHTFFEVIRPLGLKNPALETAFRVMQTALLGKLPEVYRELNQIFTAAQVLPDLNVSEYLGSQAGAGASGHETVHNAPSSQAQPQPAANPELLAAPIAPASSPPGASAAAPPVRPAAVNGSAAAQPPVTNAYSTASQMVSWQRQRGNANGFEETSRAASPVGLPPRNTSSAATLKTLSQIKNRIVETPDAPTAWSLKQQIVEASPPDFMLNAQEEDAVEMVEGLFQGIAQTERVAEGLHAELRSLQLPLLRIMLTDPESFNAPSHPARQAMNQLAVLVDQDSINLNANLHPVRETIRSILASEDDVQGFAQALPSLDELVAREQRIIERNRQRIREISEGQQRLIQATRCVERELTRLFDRAMPQALIEVVERGWKELMRLAFLRHGIKSRQWSGTLSVLRELLWHLQPERNMGNRQPRAVEELLVMVSQGLSRVSEDSGSWERIVGALRQLMQTGITDTTPMVQYTGADFDSDSLAARLAIQTETDKNLLRWLKRARALEVLQWFESSSDTQQPKLLQLLWKADDASQFTFANRQGTRSLAFTLTQVAEQLRDGTLERVHEAALPAVDQGLDALIQKMYDKLAYDSSHDQLTGLLTRKEFSRCLAQCVADASENSAQYTLIFIDIRQFKVINNTCGYEAGDRFLLETADRIRATVKEVAEAETTAESAAVISRVGADQFALLLPVLSEKPGYRLAVELKAAIEDNRFVENEHSFVIQTAVAMLGFDHRNQKIMELLRSVEAATEISKRAGSKDIQIVLPGDERLEELDEAMTWVTRINRALDEDNLKLRCQMIAPLDTAASHLPHYEILLTIIDDDGEHMPPAEFIKAAEDYNRMGAVDRWVIERVLRWMMAHPEQLGLSGGFSINLSGHSMNDETFLDFIFDALVRYQVPRDKLIFEITETTAVNNLEDAADFITEMRSIGCRFSLDDFGAGQSSYSYLKRLPVDFIKIDGSFIRDITNSDVDFALVRSITEMGHYLNKKVIAEYVSDPEILASVTGIGVDYAQGHVHGVPILLDHLVLGHPSTGPLVT